MNRRRMLKRLEEEIIDQANLLSTLDESSDAYVNVAKHVDDLRARYNELLESNRLWENVLSCAKIACGVIVPVVTTLVCLDIEKDGVVRSKTFPTGICGKFFNF